MQKLLRTLAVIMAAMLVVFMVGCGDDETGEDDGEDEAVEQPSATTATTSPAAGSEVAPNASLTITLDEAVDGVTVNGTAAAGSGKTWDLKSCGS